jgi:hypothetical protein
VAWYEPGSRRCTRDRKKKYLATELAQPAGERAETQVTSKKARNQHNCSSATTRVRQKTVKKPIERERQVFTEETIFAEQI